MKSLLLLLLLVPAVATAAEIQLDHTFGTAPLATQSLTFSPDEKRLAVAGSDGVKIYEATTGRLLENRAGAQLFTMCVAWSRDGKSLAAGGFTFDPNPHGEILLWRPHESVHRWKTDAAVIKSLSFSPDGQFLASASGGDVQGERETGAIRVWSTNTRRLVRTLGTYYGFDARVSFSTANCVAFTYEGFQTSERRVLSWPAAQLLEKNDESHAPLAWNRSGQLLPTRGLNALVLQQKGDVLRRVTMSSQPENSSATFVAQNTKSEKVLARVELGQAYSSATFSDNLLAISSAQGVKVWRLTLNSAHLRLLYTLNRTVAPDQLAISGDGSTLGIATNRGLLLLDRDLKVQRLLSDLRPNRPISFSHDGRQLWAGGWFDMSGTTPRLLTKAVRDEFAPLGVNVPSPDGTRLVASGALCLLDGKRVPLLVPDVSEDDPKATKPLGAVFRAHWREDGEKFVVTSASEGGSSSDDGFFVFDKNGRFERELRLERTRLQPRDAIFSQGGATILTASISMGYDPSERTNQRWTKSRVDFWDARTGAHKTAFFPPRANSSGEVSDTPRYVKIPSDGRAFAVSGSFVEGNRWEERVRFFRSYSGEQIASLPLQSIFYNRGSSWAFLDAKRVVSLNQGALEVWNWNAHKLLSRNFLVPDGAKIRVLVSPTSP